MPNLTQIELPSGSTYDLVDQGARDLIAAINNWEYVVLSSSSSASEIPAGVVIGSTTGTLAASADTMYKIYLVPAQTAQTNDAYDEYITVDKGSGSPRYVWEVMGQISLPDMSNYVKNKSGHSGGTAGDLAYKDTASGSGTVAVPKTFTTTITPAAKNVSVTGTTTGSVSETKSTVTVSKASSGTATYTPQGSNADSSVTGSCTVTAKGSISVGTGTANYTPAGSNAASAVSGSCSVTPTGSISTGSGTANYTPGGTVGTPTISVKTAGATTTIKNPTSKTVVTDMSVADPSATTATGELVYCSVSGTKLSLKKFVETTGDSITTENKTVKTGDAAYQSTQPSWTGTGVELKFTGSSSSGTISGTAEAQTFTGTGAQLKFTGSSASGTISGTAAGQTFTGTGARLVTDSEVLTGASFSGASMTSSGSYTPAAGTASTTIATTENKTVSVTVS